MNEQCIDIYVCGSFNKELLTLAVNQNVGLFPEVQNWTIVDREVDLCAFVWYNVCPTIAKNKAESIRDSFSHCIAGLICGRSDRNLGNFVIISHSLNAGTCVYGPFRSRREGDKWGSSFFNDWGTGHSWSVEQLNNPKDED